MPDIPAEWRTVLHCILPHPTQARILAQQNGVTWSLPYVERNELIWMPDIGPVMPEIMALLRRRSTVLYSPYYVITRQPEKWVDGVYLLENLSTDTTLPDAMAWIGRDELPSVANENHRRILASVIVELEGAPASSLLPAWSRRGWFVEAEAWILGQLAQVGYQVKAPIELVRTWGISCVLRASTDHGLFYFKVASVLPLFGHEPMLMQALSNVHPDLVPAPLAVDVDRRWMLLRDLGPSLRTSNDTAIYEMTMRTLARIQVAYVGHTDDLASFGCIDRRLERLSMQIDPLLSDTENLGPLSDDEINALRALSPHLKERLVELGTHPIPPTLIHGDLNVGNVAIGNTQPCFFDWTDGSISHPFFDLITLLDEMVPAENGKELETRLLNAYFEQWAPFAPLEQLHAIWRIAEPLASLHQAVSYQHIAQTLEGTSKQEITGGTAYFLRKLLKNLAVRLNQKQNGT